MTEEQKKAVKENQVLEKLKQAAGLTVGMKEFVITINMCLDAPIVNTGCVIPVNMGSYKQLWIVVNMEEYGEFLTADQLSKIQALLTKGTPKALNDIAKVCPTVVCAPCDPVVSMDMLLTPTTGSLMMGLFLLNAYLKNPHNRLKGQDINYCHFASRCRIYFNKYPAGLKAGTSIEMAGNKFTPHKLAQLKPENKVYLMDFVPKRRELALITGGKRVFQGRPESFCFPEDHYLKLSEMAATVTEFVAVYEKLSAKIVDAAKPTETKSSKTKKVSKKKPAKKK